MIELRIDNKNFNFQRNKIEFDNSVYIEIREDQSLYLHQNQEVQKIKNDDILTISNKKVQIIDFEFTPILTQRKSLNQKFEELQKKNPELLNFLKKIIK